MSRVLALSGGVGGAKLAHGLARILPAEELTVCCNTGDDFVHLGLQICPDLDTVLYTLSGRANPVQGWGRAGETWHFLETLKELGGEAWFNLGDADVALHVYRTWRLAAGAPLSTVTAAVARRFGLGVTVAPMTDDPVATTVYTRHGELSFQHYFVRELCRPEVTGFNFEGAPAARPSAPVEEAFDDPALRAIVFCPSNPYVSIGPILAVPRIGEAILQRRVPSVAVSPIVAGAALKGPAAKMMTELGLEPCAANVARLLDRSIDGFVLDEADAAQQAEIEALGLAVEVAPTVMRDDADRAQLAGRVLAFADRLTPRLRR